MNVVRTILVALLLIVVGGCTHSRVIQVTVTNTSNETVSNIVIDYPEATFGINILGPGKSFQYKIKPTATGALKIEFLNYHAVDRVSAGPMVHKNDEGSVEIKLTQDGATCEARLTGNN